MTNEVTTPSAIPAFLQAHVAQNQGRPTADMASLSTAQNSTPRLSLRGKMFRFMEGQDEVLKSKGPIEVFIAGVEPGAGLFTKTLYLKPYGGADSAGEPPDCASADGVRPDPWINQPQHGECKTCPKNQWGSATSRRGRPAKACHDSKRLYIARDDDGVKDVELSKRTLYLSQIPVSSLVALAEYGKKITEMGVEPWMVKTRLSLDEDSEFPEVLFEVGGFIAETDVGPMKERVAKREWATSRNLMLQTQPQRQVLPPHLQGMLGAAAPASVTGGPTGTTNNMAPAAVDPGLAAQAETVLSGTAGSTTTGSVATGPAPSNGDVLKNW